MTAQNIGGVFTDFPPSGEQIGPFVDGNNNIYVVVLGDVSGDIEVTKSSAPLTSWAIQTTNEPTADSGYQNVAAAVNGTLIEILVRDSTTTDTLLHFQFNMSDAGANPDEWVSATPTTVWTDAGSGPPTEHYVHVRVRSDGDVIVMYSGEIDRNHGTNYDRAKYAREEGSGWTANVLIFGAASDLYDHNARSIAGGNSDTTWFMGDVNGNLLAVDLNSSNTLGTELTVDTNAIGRSDIGTQSASYDSGGTEKIVIAWYDGTNPAQRVISGGSLQTATAATGYVASERPTCIADDSRNIAYVVYTDQTNDDVEFIWNKDEGGWSSTPVLIHDNASAATNSSAAIINYGSGDKLAVLFISGTNLWYTEYPLVRSFPAVSAVKKRNDLVKLRR